MNIHELAAAKASIEPISELRLGGGEDKPGDLTGWAQTGTLITRDANRGVSMQAKLRESSVFTVQFGTILPANTRSNPIAKITWSVNGVQIRRRISVIDGASVSGVGSMPSVKIYDGLTAAMGGTPDISYPMTVTVSKGSRPSQNQPPTLKPEFFRINFTPYVEYFDEVALPAGSAIVFPVPTEAGIISANVSAAVSGLAVNPTEADYVIEMWDNANTTLKSFFQRSEFIGLAPGTAFIAFRAVTQDFNVGCTFGVDG